MALRTRARTALPFRKFPELNKSYLLGVQPSVLRSARDLENLRLLAANAQPCGRIKDIYFDDASWTVRFIVAAPEPRHCSHKQILLTPEQIELTAEDSFVLNLDEQQLGRCPLASSVLPVCKQYASLAFASPGASRLEAGYLKSDPHLRSAKAVRNYRINVGGEFGGTLADFLLDDESWEIRNIAVEQIMDRKKVLFHVQPQAVERFSWSTQRVFLRNLQPMLLDEEPAAIFSLPAALGHAVA